MKGTSKTRTQRRMEKRQAVILLVLVLVVSLASFTLGVIVGRRGGERDLAQKIQRTDKILVAQTLPPGSVPPSTVTTAPQESINQPSEPVAEETKLSFYDDLSKKTVPLGSGINLPPVEKQEAATAVTPPIDLPAQPIVQKKSTENSTSVKTVTEEKPVKTIAEVSASKMPEVASAGKYAVQIGSFGSAADAIALKQKMLAKKYPASVVEADLGKKGLWYRVKIGPYENSATAQVAQKFLEKKEKIKGFVTRR